MLVQLPTPRYQPINAAAVSSGLFYLETTSLHTVVRLPSHQENVHLCGSEFRLQNNQCVLVEDCTGVSIENVAFVGAFSIPFLLSKLQIS